MVSNINSNYGALVGEVVNHSLKNIQFDANYTWSHGLDFAQNALTHSTTALRSATSIQTTVRWSARSSTTLSRTFNSTPITPGLMVLISRKTRSLKALRKTGTTPTEITV